MSLRVPIVEDDRPLVHPRPRNRRVKGIPQRARRRVGALGNAEHDARHAAMLCDGLSLVESVKGFDGLDEVLGFGFENAFLEGGSAEVRPAVPIDFVIYRKEGATR